MRNTLLADSIAVDVIAWLISSLPSDITPAKFDGLHKNIHPALSPRKLGLALRSAPWLVRSKNGWLVLDGALLAATDERQLVIDPNWRKTSAFSQALGRHFQKSALVVLGLHGGLEAEWTNWIQSVGIGEPSMWRMRMHIEHVVGKELVISTKKLQEVRKSNGNTREFSALFDTVTERQYGNWTILSCGEVEDDDLDGAARTGLLGDAGLGFQRWHLAEPEPTQSCSPIARQWLRTIGDKPLPFSLKDRFELLRRSPEDLRRCVAAHRRMKGRRLQSEFEESQMMLLEGG
jgi:hypothetical protein